MDLERFKQNQSTFSSIQMLILQDTWAEAEAIAAHLPQTRDALNWQWVETDVQYLACLCSRVDIVIAKTSCNLINPHAALTQLQLQHQDAAFIVVSDRPSVADAVAWVKAGAADYLPSSDLAQRLPRLIDAMLEHRHPDPNEEPFCLNCSVSVETPQSVSAQQLQTIIMQSLDAIVVVDNQQRIRFVNTAALELFDRSLDDLLDQVFGFPVVGSDYLEVDVYSVGGSCRTAQMRVAQIEWDGQPAYLVTLRDITGLKQIESELRQSEERFRLAAGAVEGIIYDWDAITGSVYRSDGMTQVLGIDPAEAPSELGWWLERTHPDDLEHIHSDLESRIATRSDRYSYEYRVCHVDGRWIDVSDHGYIVYDDTGALVRVVGSIADITARKASLRERQKSQKILEQRAHELTQLNQLLIGATNRLEQRNRELDEFTYAVSHDLKAPLRGIKNLSAWLEEDLSGQISDEISHNLHLMKTRVQRMQSLIDGLLTYSRVGRHQVEVEQVDVALMLWELIDSHSLADFELCTESPLPVFPTHALMLRQVFANLLDNAIKYCGRPDCKVSVSAKDHGDYYEFAVADNGIGVDPDDHERIFGIFQTVRTSHQSEQTGIGLALVKKIVEIQGGTVWVESNPEKGATFRFTWFKQPEIKSV